MREIGAAVSRQRGVINGLDGTPVNKGSVNQVVDKNEKQHNVKRGWVNDGLMRRSLSEAHRNVYMQNARGQQVDHPDISPSATNK